MNRWTICTMIALTLNLGLINTAATASDKCTVIAEISVELVAEGALAVCLRSGNPIACAIAGAGQDVATKEVAKEGVAAGCRWFVRRQGKTLIMKMEGEGDNKKSVIEASEELRKIPGMEVLD
jgi:hypothetical protein